MKTNAFKINALIPALAIALIGGGYVLAQSYLKTEVAVQKQEKLNGLLDRLSRDQRLCEALKNIRAGDSTTAVQTLDCLVDQEMDGIAVLLASADELTRTYAEDALKRMAMLKSVTQAAAITTPEVDSGEPQSQ